ncbi:hypothetical protein BJ741DRAFT_673393 [Chytriomyces cf. hyalinus JEL632]|nr:hypothetical protein BJ741DRAFT_673393 [Chytriomyces cf. hyalinus JEL632]
MKRLLLTWLLLAHTSTTASAMPVHRTHGSELEPDRPPVPQFNFPVKLVARNPQQQPELEGNPDADGQLLVDSAPTDSGFSPPWDATPNVPLSLPTTVADEDGSMAMLPPAAPIDAVSDSDALLPSSTVDSVPQVTSLISLPVPDQTKIGAAPVIVAQPSATAIHIPPKDEGQEHGVNLSLGKQTAVPEQDKLGAELKNSGNEHKNGASTLSIVVMGSVSVLCVAYCIIA